MKQLNDLTFFTNEPGRKLIDRFKTLFKDTKELDIIVGYFYLSGLYQLHEELKNVDRIRIIVGIHVGKDVWNLVQLAENIKKRKEEYLNTIIEELSSAHFEDNLKKEEAIRDFISWIANGKLQIKYYPYSPLHAKLYIFKSRSGIDLGRVITGSSNFTISGLKDNLEFNVELKNATDVQFAIERFEELWEKCIDISEDIVATIKRKTWLNDEITPYELYLKFLYEFFGEQVDVENEEDIPFPEGFKKLQYQVEAVIDAEKKLKTHGGVFLSDVVDLGKTFIAAMLASKLRKRTLVFAPPHLKEYWEETLRKFLVPGFLVESAGKLPSLDLKDFDDYKLVIVDEAHRFRNEDTKSYKVLHEICRKKNVILVTATPYNNRPSDVKAQLLLFQEKRRPTIPGIYSIDAFFKRLEDKIKKVDRRKNPELYRKVLKEVGEEIRKKIFTYVMVRRTRKEVMEFYKEDLEKQGVTFPKVNKPVKVYYQLDGELDNLFNETIATIKSLTYARYTPALYLRDRSTENIERLSQRNLAGLMKVLLLKRLESSFHSFVNSLERFLKSHKQVLEEFERSGKVYMSKKINVYERIEELLAEVEESDSFDLEEILEDREVTVYDKSQLTEEFHENLKRDVKAIEELYSKWSKVKSDPKVEELLRLLKKDERLTKAGKILIFTEFAETAEYLKKKLAEEFGNSVISYTSASGRSERDKILENFDPNLPKEKQKDDIRILVTTDVLAEGINLHRANVIINYDIPWNPTRVLQRVGRINRVGTTFSEIHIFNFFPVEKTESEIGLEAAAVAKLQAFHEALGEDAKYLTEEEETSPRGLFERINAPVEDEEEDSFLYYLKELQKIKGTDKELYERIKRLPKKARSSRYWNRNFLITLIKKGKVKKIFLSYEDKPAREIDFLEAVELLRVDKGEKKAPLERELFYSLLSKNLTAFHKELSELQRSLPGGDGYEKKVEKELRAFKKLVSGEEKKLVREVLTLIRESGFPRSTMRDLYKTFISKSDVKGKLKVLTEFLDKYKRTSPHQEEDEKVEVILSQLFLKERS